MQGHRRPQPAKGGDGHRPDMLVRIVEMVHQIWNGGRADGRENDGKLIPLFPREGFADPEGKEQRPKGARPELRQGAASTLVNRFVRTPEVGDGFGKKFPLPHRGENLLKQDQREERLEHGHEGGRHARHRPGHRDAGQMLRVGQVQQIDHAQQMDQSRGHKIDEGRVSVRRRIPSRAKQMEKGEIKQGEPADHPPRRRCEQWNADEVAMLDEFGRQPLPLHRGVERLVSASHFIPFDINEHIRQTGGQPHCQRAERADDRQRRQRPGDKNADHEKAKLNAKENRPGGPGKASLPHPEPGPDAAANHGPGHAHAKVDGAEPVERAGQQNDDGKG